LKQARDHIDAERQYQHIEAKRQHAMHQRQAAHLTRRDLHVRHLRGHADNEGVVQKVKVSRVQPLL